MENHHLRQKINDMLKTMNHLMDGQAQKQDYLETCWNNFVLDCRNKQLPLTREAMVATLQKAENAHETMVQIGKMTREQATRAHETEVWVLDRMLSDSRIAH